MVKIDSMRMLKDFFETENFVKNLNTTFIVMVPKKGGQRSLRIIGL